VIGHAKSRAFAQDLGDWISRQGACRLAREDQNFIKRARRRDAIMAPTEWPTKFAGAPPTASMISKYIGCVSIERLVFCRLYRDRTV
jgi:hypothetical protein